MLNDPMIQSGLSELERDVCIELAAGGPLALKDIHALRGLAPDWRTLHLLIPNLMIRGMVWWLPGIQGLALKKEAVS